MQGARDSTNQSLPACTSRTSDGIKGRVPSFLSISFNDAVPTARRFVREIVERSKNTSVSSRGLRSSAISPSCDPGTFDGGASYRLKYRPIRAVLPACNAQRYKKRGAFISRPFVCTTNTNTTNANKHIIIIFYSQQRSSQTRDNRSPPNRS